MIELTPPGALFVGFLIALVLAIAWARGLRHTMRVPTDQEPIGQFTSVEAVDGGVRVTGKLFEVSALSVGELRGGFSIVDRVGISSADIAAAADREHLRETFEATNRCRVDVRTASDFFHHFAAPRPRGADTIEWWFSTSDRCAMLWGEARYPLGAVIACGTDSHLAELLWSFAPFGDEPDSWRLGSTMIDAANDIAARIETQAKRMGERA